MYTTLKPYTKPAAPPFRSVLTTALLALLLDGCGSDPSCPQICAPGSFKECSYSGPAGTEGVGMCKAGKDFCNSDGTAWLGCAGEVLPSPETCATPGDDNCDGIIPTLDDQNGCTADTCDASGTVQHTPLDIDDADACTVDSCDAASGTISHQPINTDDNNFCTIDSCDPKTGVAHAIDSSACPTYPCLAMGGNINDGNPCTEDICDAITGMPIHIPIMPDDGNACTIDMCNSNTGISHIPVTIDDGNACTVDACDPSTGFISHTIIPFINDNNACTIDTCDPLTGVVTHTPSAVINDNDACTIDTCDPLTGVVTHTPSAVINDNNACTTDSCNPATGLIMHNIVDVDDNNPCTIDGCNFALGVYHNPIICSGDPDPAACYLNVCDPGSGICQPTDGPFIDNFINNASGWTLDGQWQIGTAAASSGQTSGFPDPSQDSDGWVNGENGVAGVIIGGNVGSTGGIGTFQYMTSPLIDLSSVSPDETVYLSFYRHLNSAPSGQMISKIDVFDGSGWVSLWQSSSAIQDNNWQLISHDVSAYKHTSFRVRFGFSAAPGLAAVSGWNIDNVRVSGLPPACP